MDALKDFNQTLRDLQAGYYVSPLIRQRGIEFALAQQQACRKLWLEGRITTGGRLEIETQLDELIAKLKS